LQVGLTLLTRNLLLFLSESPLWIKYNFHGHILTPCRARRAPQIAALHNSLRAVAAAVAEMQAEADADSDDGAAPPDEPVAITEL
jgi:hypothetical protein